MAIHPQTAGKDNRSITPAWLFHRLVSVCLLIAWVSLGSQVRLLVGRDGLAPVASFLEAVAADGRFGFWQLPTFLWWSNGDAVLVGGTALGALLATAALFNCWPRRMFLLNAVLYLSYTVGGQSFLGFQWDNLMVEMLCIAALLPANDQSWTARWLTRLLLVKIMVESGIAKLQSPAGDWLDGSAMTMYFETAPLPTALAWHAHHMPQLWHQFTAYWTLFFELIVPWFVFMGPTGRMLAGGIFGLFLVVDSLTANYGFFTLQTAALCIMLFDGPACTAGPKTIQETVRVLLSALWLFCSLLGGMHQFADIDLFPAIQQTVRPLRLANNYHLFSQITPVRVEPEFQTSHDQQWHAHIMHYKPGPLDRPPPFITPHQPRVDFRLWFYGLSFQRGMPRYVEAILDKLCHHPQHIQPLFASTLPAAPDAVRIVFWQYTFTTPDASTHQWWQRTHVAETNPFSCEP